MTRIANIAFILHDIACQAFHFRTQLYSSFCYCLSYYSICTMGGTGFLSRTDFDSSNQKNHYNTYTRKTNRFYQIVLKKIRVHKLCLKA